MKGTSAFLKVGRKKKTKDWGKVNLLKNGGLGQDGMNLLDKYGIEYHITKTFKNGVRIGNVPDHAAKHKRENGNLSWFLKTWTSKDIRRGVVHVASLKGNRHVPDGKIIYGVYKGGRVGGIRTHGKISAAFPDKNQSGFIRKKRNKK